MTIKDLMRRGFKFTEHDSTPYDHIPKTERCYSLTWISPQFGKYSEYWLELVLRKTSDTIHDACDNIAYCWLNWDLGGGRHFVHIPNLQNIQTVEKLDAFLEILGVKIEIRPEENINKSLKEYKKVFEKYHPELY